MSHIAPISHSESPTLVSVKTAAQMLGSTPLSVAELCENGHLPSSRIDDRIVIPTSAVNEYASQILEAS